MFFVPSMPLAASQTALKHSKRQVRASLDVPLDSKFHTMEVGRKMKKYIPNLYVQLPCLSVENSLKYSYALAITQTECKSEYAQMCVYKYIPMF